MAMHRRHLLIGAGAVVGLPFLESLLPRALRAEEASPNSFAIFLRHPHGVVHDSWWPKAIGPLTKENMPAAWACAKMIPHLERTAYIRNLKMGFPNTNCHHNIHALQLFTGTKPRYGSQANSLASSESMEWTIAKQFHPDTDPLVMFAGNRTGFLDDTISFRADGSKVIGENNPMKVYNRIFGMAPKEDSTALMRKSVNDLVRQQIKELEKNPRLSSSDKERLDLHFSTIRDVEKRIARTLPDAKVTKINQYGKDSESLKAANRDHLDQVIKLQLDVIALAISSGAVRGVSYQIGAGIDHTRFYLDGKQLPDCHAASHYTAIPNDDAANIAILRRLDVFWQECIAYLANALSQDKIDGKPYLDYGVIHAATELQAGRNHLGTNVPQMLVGSANGRLKTGGYFDFGEITNKTLLATIGWAIGLKNPGSNEPMSEYGSSEHKMKGRIDALMKT